MNNPKLSVEIHESYESYRPELWDEKKPKKPSEERWSYRIVNGSRTMGGADGFKSRYLAMMAGIERMSDELEEGLINPFDLDILR